METSILSDTQWLFGNAAPSPVTSRGPSQRNPQLLGKEGSRERRTRKRTENPDGIHTGFSCLWGGSRPSLSPQGQSFCHLKYHIYEDALMAWLPDHAGTLSISSRGTGHHALASPNLPPLDWFFFLPDFTHCAQR